MRRRGVQVLVAGAAAGALALGWAGASSSAVEQRAEPRPPVVTSDAITPLVARKMADVEPVVGSDGRMHLAYELSLVNLDSARLTIARVEVLDADDPERVVQVVEGERLAQALRFVGGLEGPAVAPAAMVWMHFAVEFEADAQVPARLEHRFSFAAGDREEAPEPLVSGRLDVLSGEGVVVAPPLDGGNWWATGGCCWPPDYHRTATLPVNGEFWAPERYAIDFVQLTADGRLFTGPQDELSSYAFYGAPVKSVADGRVVRVLDGLPDNVPGEFPPGATADTAGGNYVIVDIGRGRYAFYAHLQPGSLRVQVGDRVRTGDVLGRLGNSGNSDAPHLHFHVTDGTSPLGANGLPYRFTDFTSRGRVVTDPQVVFAGAPVELVPDSDGAHRDQLPLDLLVVDFAPADDATS